MTPDYTKIHNRFKLNGHHFNHSELKEVAYSLIKEGEKFEQVIGEFLTDWLNDHNYVVVQTSGSTGKPKQLKINKQAMVNSALATGDYFGLAPGDSALHCLPSQYIAGKMMLVRAMILGLELDCIEPSSWLVLQPEQRYNFSAMVPIQAQRSLASLEFIDQLIIGGTKVSKELSNLLSNFETKCFETYGMTETVTHVAVKALPSKSQKGSNYFEALPKVTFSKDDRNCLVINAPKIIDENITTNDIIQLVSESKFQWLGRFDNVINSGGVKLFPEQIEEKLQTIISSRFIISSKADDNLGEKLILIVENTKLDTDRLMAEIHALSTLDKFEIPKTIYALDQFVETKNGKVQRQQTTKLALQ